MKLNEAIINIRVELQNSKIKKSGQNKFAGFNYYELSDFLPTLNQLMLKYGVNDQVSFGKEYAELTLRKDDETQGYTIPFIMFDTPKNKNGQDSMQPIQYLGALNTYYKRYLYLNAFGITDGEVIDAMDNTQYKTQSKSSDDDKKAYWNEFTTICKSLNVDAKEFLNEWCQVTDPKAIQNTVSKFLKDKDTFVEQLENYRDNKLRQ